MKNTGSFVFLHLFPMQRSGSFNLKLRVLFLSPGQMNMTGKLKAFLNRLTD
jgi:hypothetical protein